MSGLYVRNLTNRAITANAIGANAFTLSPAGTLRGVRQLPVSVAQLDGFQRLWNQDPAVIEVATDPDFTNIITELPSDVVNVSPATPSEAGVVRQATGVSNSSASDVEGVVSDLNGLLGALRSAGILGE